MNDKMKVTSGQAFPRISVITPSYNAAEYIEDAVRSVLAQNYPNFEHIVVDGGSTDGTVEILKKYPHLRWISEPDHGQADAMNKGFEMASGDIIVYLNADDYFEPGAFFTAAKHLDKSRGIYFIVGDLNVVDDNGKRLYGHDGIRVDLFGMLQWWKYLYPQNPVSYFYFREVQEKVGPFDVNNHYVMDHEFLLRCALYYELHVIKETLGNYRYLPGTKTFNFWQSDSSGRQLAFARGYWKYLPLKQQIQIAYSYYAWIVSRTLPMRGLRRVLRPVKRYLVHARQMEIEQHACT